MFPSIGSLFHPSLKNMLNVLVVDDHRSVRIGIKVMLSEIFPESAVEEAAVFPEALEFLSQKNYDLVVLDIGIPGGGDIGMIDLLRSRQAKIPILIYSAAEESKNALRFLKAGATGFLSKGAAPEEHIMALKAVAENQRYISSHVNQTLLRSFSEGVPLSKIHQKYKLTARETEISNLLMEGKWTNEISNMLGVKSNTVSTMKARIFEKLGAKNLVEFLGIVNQTKHF